MNRLCYVATRILFIHCLFLFISSCSQPTPTQSCPSRKDDTDGYLLKICTYIREKGIDVSPADPTAYQIKRIEEGVYEGQPATWVYLDCCFMGDVAIINKASGEIINFWVGPQ